jgi:Zn finger protein HypA/HybF involved in hydrogenase expression
VKKMIAILFQCPECKKFFEYDLVGEYELVSCPICGNDFQTIKKENVLGLESFECNRPKPSGQKSVLLTLEKTTN